MGRFLILNNETLISILFSAKQLNMPDTIHSIVIITWVLQLPFASTILTPTITFICEIMKTDYSWKSQLDLDPDDATKISYFYLFQTVWSHLLMIRGENHLVISVIP